VVENHHANAAQPGSIDGRKSRASQVPPEPPASPITGVDGERGIGVQGAAKERVVPGQGPAQDENTGLLFAHPDRHQTPVVVAGGFTGELGNPNLQEPQTGLGGYEAQAHTLLRTLGLDRRCGGRELSLALGDVQKPDLNRAAFQTVASEHRLHRCSLPDKGLQVDAHAGDGQVGNRFRGTQAYHLNRDPQTTRQGHRVRALGLSPVGYQNHGPRSSLGTSLHQSPFQSRGEVGRLPRRRRRRQGLDQGTEIGIETAVGNRIAGAQLVVDGLHGPDQLVVSCLGRVSAGQGEALGAVEKNENPASRPSGKSQAQNGPAQDYYQENQGQGAKEGKKSPECGS
jgi:hypothetical protein